MATATAVVTEKMAVNETSRVSGDTDTLSEPVRLMASVETTMLVTSREQRSKTRAAAAVVNVAEFMPPLTETKNARQMAKSMLSSPSRVVVMTETFHTSVPAVGDFTVGRRVLGTLGVQTAGGGTTGRACKGIVTYIGKLSRFASHSHG